jgi:hypothetical protein
MYSCMAWKHGMHIPVAANNIWQYEEGQLCVASAGLWAWWDGRHGQPRYMWEEGSVLPAPNVCEKAVQHASHVSLLEPSVSTCASVASPKPSLTMLKLEEENWPLWPYGDFPWLFWSMVLQAVPNRYSELFISMTLLASMFRRQYYWRRRLVTILLLYILRPNYDYS